MINIILIPIALFFAYFLVFLIRKQICYFIWLAREAFRFKVAWQVEMIQCCIVLGVIAFLSFLMLWDIRFILGAVGV